MLVQYNIKCIVILYLMHYLSLEDFLKNYKRSPADRMKYEDFISSASVIVGKYEYSLKDYIKSKNIDKSTVMLLLNYIKNREGYLTRFYNMSLRITGKNEYIHGNMKPMTKLIPCVPIITNTKSTRVSIS